MPLMMDTLEAVGSFTSGQIAGMIAAAGLAVATAIATLWKALHTLYRKVVELAAEVGELKGRQGGVVEFSHRVLQTVADATMGRPLRHLEPDHEPVDGDTGPGPKH
jgi:hypothetical protein